MKKQTRMILRHLQAHGSISAREAMNLTPPCFRLAARVKEIRDELGEERVVTESEPHEGGSHARYVWVAPAQADLFDQEAA